MNLVLLSGEKSAISLSPFDKVSASVTADATLIGALVFFFCDKEYIEEQRN